MTKEFPDPNTKRECAMDRVRYIDSYDGVSKVTIDVPYTEYPMLPYKVQYAEQLSSPYKLIFPYGSFTGWYSHVELRKAIDLGCTILKVHRSIYFKENIFPFVDFVTDMYALRNKYKLAENAMELVVKLVLNSLYGKFGQKFENKENLEPFNHTLEELAKLEFFERIGDYIRIKKSSDRPANHCFPIWALYVTAYGRLYLHDFIRRAMPVYVDTDSLITKKEFSTSTSLGALKKEAFIKEGIIVKPKFYMINNTCKVKGLGVRLTRNQFLKFIAEPTLTYKKFMKFKESIRRGFIPNEIVDMTKSMNLEDDKRLWDAKFDSMDFQISEPLEAKDGIILTHEIERELEKEL